MPPVYSKDGDKLCVTIEESKSYSMAQLQRLLVRCQDKIDNAQSQLNALNAEKTEIQTCITTAENLGVL